MKKKLTLTDILVTIVIALIFSVIYKVWGPLYNILSVFGLHVDQLIYGMWFMAATIAFLIIRKPGVALIAELAAAQGGEFLFGGQWGGISLLLYGFVQGIGCEVVFALFKYKSYHLFIACLAAIGATIGSLFLDVFYGYIDQLALWNLTLLIVARLIGAIVITGVFAFYIVKALEKTGVTKIIRPLSADDYQSLEEEIR
ncbi:substrate-specific component YkoE of thiamin-regulated ECF transporter for HydroxyMethylPyrimidine [Gracilibacillus boraciitolerans JCM 21714]|uniref:Substrate-specific component YkoE of thiamin-regulated ECF transporter for HydroxyMethylPyrimidine n=1 Tax=Gracilibacillus boraciitolerans JCM 21714 TaxID=1298598 RepID=W4VDI0_9BACI|nr:ECF transporter S component [Gracilibacillus boraciitolerans]GAE91440.1 substrate-specific component YkoE of thiamin-regulated ECF transporter for HydroxyMethylPyrimidine [Gracilibacillus boraciitolerans JCM 21714]